jgi:uncharacterized protein YciI
MSATQSSVPQHHILFYEYVPDIAERRGPYREAHLGRIRAEKEAGRIVMAGALEAIGRPGDASAGSITGGALVFQGVDPEAIEAFAREDPYAQAGLVTSHRVERWNLV